MPRTLPRAPRRALAPTVTLTVAAALLAAPTAASHAAAATPGEGDDLYLVTLRSPGSATLPDFARPVVAEQVRAEQDAVLATVGSPEPAYRWTTVLNGFAVRLPAADADRLAASTEVATVERDSVRPLADVAGGRSGGAAVRSGPARGGRGVVIGVVDTGLAPDSPVFAQRRSGGTTGFRGGCETAPDWDVAECDGKVVGARHFVEGFGVDRLRAASTVSPRDSDGHGTRTAALAAGNAQVPVTIGSDRLGRFGGQAPDASLAVYKACWSAPDPRDDGCSAADLVSAVDTATADGVDVLTLAVGGPSRIDTVERALLGATEAGVVVVAAVGNDGPGRAAHVSPWVTTVGGSTSAVRRGRVVLPGGRRLDGAMLSRRTVGPARVVRGADVAAPGSTATAARYCRPGSLDAARVAGAVVLCDRGRVGRVEKSRAVALADGVAMVLLNRGRGSVDADVHSVPTVHLPERASRALSRWLTGHPRGRVRVEPRGVVDRTPGVAGFSGSSARGSAVLKPDVVAPATDVVAAVPDGSWDVTSGTSTATARTAGVAAALLARRLSPSEVRSALVTTARPLPAPTRRAGGGLVRPTAARRAGLAVLVRPGAYREWLAAPRRTPLNTPTITLSGAGRTARRTVTNVSGRRLYFSSTAQGFGNPVQVTPAAVRLGPGESATFRVRVGGRGADGGYVVWRGATGTVTRLPVTVGR